MKNSSLSPIDIIKSFFFVLCDLPIIIIFTILDVPQNSTCAIFRENKNVQMNNKKYL